MQPWQRPRQSCRNSRELWCLWRRVRVNGKIIKEIQSTKRVFVCSYVNKRQRFLRTDLVEAYYCNKLIFFVRSFPFALLFAFAGLCSDLLPLFHLGVAIRGNHAYSILVLWCMMSLLCVVHQWFIFLFWKIQVAAWVVMAKQGLKRIFFFQPLKSICAL